MPQLLTVEQFREMFGEIDTPTPEQQISRPLGVAHRRIKLWVGVAVFDTAVSAGVDDETKLDLQAAVGYLAMHFLIANFNTVVRPGGIVKSEKVEGEAVISYLIPAETQARAQEFFDLAEEICKPYISYSSATTEVVSDE
jgi:hypothetical protein